MRERLLRESNLTLQKTDEICRAAESTSQQLKLVEPQEMAIHSVRKTTEEDRQKVKECWMCGRKHAFHTKESCPAFGKTCNKCHKLNHFAVKCRQKGPSASIKQVEEQDSEDEVYHTSALAHDPDDSQLITLKLESGNFMRFQADTGAQCNVIPVDVYKKAAKDPYLSQLSTSLWHTKSMLGLFAAKAGRSWTFPFCGWS